MKRLFMTLVFWSIPTIGWAGITFDGTDDLVTTSLDVDTYTSGTISWWQNNNFVYNDSATHAFWGETSGSTEFSAQKYSDNNFYIGWTSTGGGDDRVVVAASAGNSPQSTWIHYLLTWTDTGTSYFYANGTQIGSKANCSVATINATFLVGKQGALNNFYNGKINEFAIWNAVLTDQEIAFLALSYVKGIPLQIQLANLKLYFPMDDQSDGTSADADTVRDLSGNGNNGTGNDGANNTGLPWSAEAVLSYP